MLIKLEDPDSTENDPVWLPVHSLKVIDFERAMERMLKLDQYGSQNLWPLYNLCYIGYNNATNWYLGGQKQWTKPLRVSLSMNLLETATEDLELPQQPLRLEYDGKGKVEIRRLEDV